MSTYYHVNRVYCLILKEQKWVRGYYAVAPKKLLNNFLSRLI